MARQLRHDYEGGLYHVMSRGFQRQVIFKNDTENKHFIELLSDMVERYGVILHAYVLIPNHYHLLIETPNANASRALQWLNVSYSVWFNHNNSRSGAVFQSRYKSVLVEGEGEWALNCSAYIHLNPVRVRALGLSKTDQVRLKVGFATTPTPAQREAWMQCLREHAWSSFPAYAGYVKPPKWLTCNTLLDRVYPKGSGDSYVKFITQRIGVPDDDEIAFSQTLVLGNEEFKNRVRHLVLDSNRAKTGNTTQWKRLLPFQTIMDCMERFKGEKWEDFVDRRGDWGRDMALYNGRLQCGLTLDELGVFVGMNSCAVSRCVNRFAQKLLRQPTLARQQNGFRLILTSQRDDK